MPLEWEWASRGRTQPPEIALVNKKEKVMNETKLSLKGNWNVVKGKLKKAYGELTDDDLKYAEGQEDELVGRIQKRVGSTSAEVRRLLEKYSE